MWLYKDGLSGIMIAYSINDDVTETAWLSQSHVVGITTQRSYLLYFPPSLLFLLYQSLVIPIIGMT